MTRLIGLIGQARVGKDTVGSRLFEHHDFLNLSFATPMKRMLQTAFPDVNFYTGDRESTIDWLGQSPRHLMQTLGTEWGRNCIHPDLWTLLAERQIHAANAGGWSGVVLTDVRFPNEADMILRNGGELWQIVRPDAQPVNSHESETYAWGSYSREVILNNGTLEELYAKVDFLMEPANAS